MSRCFCMQSQPEMRSPVRTRANARHEATQDKAASHPHVIGNQGMLRLLRRQAAPTVDSGVSIFGAPQQPTQKVPQQSTQQPPQPTQQPAPPTQPMPYTATFSIAQHGPTAKAACGLPDSPNCVVSAANWHLVDKSGAPVTGNVTLSEQFTKIDGPDDVYQKLVAQKNSAVVSRNGAFGDCYGLCVPAGTEPFSLHVLQNYVVNGQIASKTLITYSPSGVMLRICQRESDGTFGNRCHRF